MNRGIENFSYEGRLRELGLLCLVMAKKSNLILVACPFFFFFETQEGVMLLGKFYRFAVLGCRLMSLVAAQ